MSLPEFCKVFLYSQSEHLKKTPILTKRCRKAKHPLVTDHFSFFKMYGGLWLVGFGF